MISFTHDMIYCLLVYLHNQTGYTTNNMYHVESPGDEPPWVTAAAAYMMPYLVDLFGLKMHVLVKIHSMRLCSSQVVQKC